MSAFDPKRILVFSSQDEALRPEEQRPSPFPMLLFFDRAVLD
jgi:hypothetical protein